MRLRHIKGSEEIIAKSPHCIHIDNNKSDSHINLSDYFNDTNKKLYIELGMGKGRFIKEMAYRYPEINFIGVEKYATVVLKALTDTFDKSAVTSLDNLYYICDDIENLSEYFLLHSIDKIFLNFSDPWPKKRHESRRLTHLRFLTLYEKLLVKDGILEFKTDNKDLFDFTLDQINNSHFHLLASTYDLHNDTSLNENNIMTEYEEKFSKQGNKICKLIAQL